MLGIFHLLPILKGWEYKSHVAERKAVVRGAEPIEARRISETGWLLGLDLMTFDCYGTVIIEYQGAEMETRRATLFPEAFRVYGALQQDPSGFVQEYYRPNPASTAGIYAVRGYSGLQGSLFPYVPSIVIKLYLPNESTQSSTLISGAAGVVAITDSKAFLISLRKVLGIKGKIDPKLLTPGPVALEVEE